MITNFSRDDELAIQTVERFWDTFPPIWHNTRAFVDQITHEKKLTMGGFAILRGIRHGKNTISQLADRGHLSRSAVSRSVDNLVGKGLISREYDQDDRRQIKLLLTPQGEQILFSVREDTREWMLSRLDTLNPKELETIISALDLLKKTFTK